MIIRENALSKKKKINEGEYVGYMEIADFIVEQIENGFARHKIIAVKNDRNGKLFYDFSCRPLEESLSDASGISVDDLEDSANYLQRKKSGVNFNKWHIANASFEGGKMNNMIISLYNNENGGEMILDLKFDLNENELTLVEFDGTGIIPIPDLFYL